MPCIRNDSKLRVLNKCCILLRDTRRSQNILLTNDDERWARNTCKQICRIASLRHASRSGCDTLSRCNFDHLTHTHFYLGKMLACIFREYKWHLEISDCSCSLCLRDTCDVFAVGLRFWSICTWPSIGQD